MANEDQYERLSDDPSVFIDKAKIYRQNEPVAHDQGKPTTNPSPKEQARPNVPVIDINTFSPEKRRILETLELLEQELKADRQIKNKNDERLRVIQKQFRDVQLKFKGFGDDARFTSAPTDLQNDIDECRSNIAIATAELATITPVLWIEWEQKRAEREQKWREKAKAQQLRLEQERYQQEQERQRKDLLNEELRAKLRAKYEATKPQRVPLPARPLQPQPERMSSSPSSAGSSGAGCILPILGIVAFVAVLSLLMHSLIIMAPIFGNAIIVVVGMFSRN